MVKQPKKVHIKTKKNIQPKKEKVEKIGTSKLEDKFANEFLDRLGVKYIRQFRAESIGRFFDFYLPDVNLLIEIDGDYYHSFNREYDKMSPMQKKNKRVDEMKDRWALINCIPLIRIWEHDINNNPSGVMDLLKKKIGEGIRRSIINENKKNWHRKIKK